jgi:short-subunit dehydrogenase
MKIVITGASSGLGRELAIQYGAKGFQLCLIARREDKLHALKNQIDSKCEVYAGDVTNRNEIERIANEFISRYGPPDIVIANAGISLGTYAVARQSNDELDEVMKTNFFGMIYTCQAFIDSMAVAGSGTLVGISSLAGLRGIPGSSAYSSSKAAAISYLESLRVELRNSGVRVLTVCPGYIRTPMTDVNTFKMPFLMDVESAAKSLIGAVDRRKSLHVMPWQMALVGFILRRLPNWIYDWFASRAPRKPIIRKNK